MIETAEDGSRTIWGAPLNAPPDLGNEFGSYFSKIAELFADIEAWDVKVSKVNVVYGVEGRWFTVFVYPDSDPCLPTSIRIPRCRACGRPDIEEISHRRKICRDLRAVESVMLT
ncbi:MAG: hypothetical protein BWY99_01932 [Synergistetes bacterium ADurb.BinA166]|nr:MAG: hypothetical protein BWY99_01932 [Synergistetes bacterium ADurb.BinA166]